MGAFGGFSPPKWGRKQKNGQRLTNSFGLGVKPGDFGSNRVEKPRFGSQKRGRGGGIPKSEQKWGRKRRIGAKRG